MTSKTAAIIGYGWLGKHFHDFSNTVALYQEIIPLSRSGKDGSLTFDALTSSALPKEVINCDNFYIFLAPAGDYEKYQQTILNLSRLIPMDKRVTLVSSTRVYGQDERCDEDQSPKPKDPQGENILKAEEIIRSTFSHHLIFRSGGQIGPDRYPVLSLIKRNITINGSDIANCIHIEDILGILKLLSQADYAGTINGVSPLKMTKKEFYTLQAQALNESPPLFNEGEPGSQKSIFSRRLEELNYQFLNPKCLPKTKA